MLILSIQIVVDLQGLFVSGLDLSNQNNGTGNANETENANQDENLNEEEQTQADEEAKKAEEGMSYPHSFTLDHNLASPFKSLTISTLYSHTARE